MGATFLVLLLLAPSLALAAPTTGSISEGTWSTPVFLSQQSAATAGYEPSVVTDAEGNGLAVWSGGSSSQRDLYSSRYEADIGWDGPVQVDRRPETVSGARLSMNGSGSALLVWEQAGGVEMSRFEKAGGWRLPVRVTENGRWPDVALANDGSAIVVWANATDVFANMSAPGGNWTQSVVVSRASPQGIRLASAGNGVGVVVSFFNATGSYARSHWATGGWNTLFNLGPPSALGVGMDGQGNYIVVWLENSSLVARRYNTSAGWEAAATLRNFSYGETPRMATLRMSMAPDGNASAVLQWRGTREYVSSFVYTKGSLWIANTPSFCAVGTYSPNDFYGPDVSMVSGGALTVVYMCTARDSANNDIGGIQSSRYNTSAGWAVSSIPSTGASSPFASTGIARVAMNGTGRALAVWEWLVPTLQSIGVGATRSLPVGWQSPATLSTAPPGAASPRVAVDAEGGAIAIWGSNGPDILATARAAGPGWGRVAPLDGGAGWAREAEIAMDAQGNAVAAWIQRTKGGEDLFANRYDKDTGWGAPSLLESASGTAAEPSVAVDGRGNAFVAWTQAAGGYSSIWSNRYSAGQGWGLPTLLEQDNATNAGDPAVFANASGSAVATWIQDAAVFAASYDPGSGWSGATGISPQGVPCQNPTVSMGAEGPATAAWQASANGTWEVHASQFTAPSGWSAEVRVSEGEGTVADLTSASDPAGNAMAVWTQWDGTFQSVMAAYLGPSAVWGSPSAMDAGPGDAAGPRVAAGGAGQFVAVWTQSDGLETRAWSNRFEAGGGWSQAERTDGADRRFAVPDVAGSPSGNFTVVWQVASSAGFGVWSTAFTPSTAATAGAQRDAALAAQVAALNASLAQDLAALNASLAAQLGALSATLSKAISDAAAAQRAALDALYADLNSTDGELRAATEALRLSLSRTDGNVTQALGQLGALQARLDALPGNSNLSRADVDAMIGALDAEVVAARGQLNSTTAGLDASASAERARVDAALDSLEASLNGTRASLATADANLTAAVDRLEGAGAPPGTGGNGTTADLAATQAQVQAAQGQAALGVGVGLVGVALGAGAVAVALRGRRARETEAGQRPEAAKKP